MLVAKTEHRNSVSCLQKDRGGRFYMQQNLNREKPGASIDLETDYVVHCSGFDITQVFKYKCILHINACIFQST